MLLVAMTHVAAQTATGVGAGAAMGVAATGRLAATGEQGPGAVSGAVRTAASVHMCALQLRSALYAGVMQPMQELM